MDRTKETLKTLIAEGKLDEIVTTLSFDERINLIKRNDFSFDDFDGLTDADFINILGKMLTPIEARELAYDPNSDSTIRMYASICLTESDKEQLIMQEYMDPDAVSIVITSIQDDDKKIKLMRDAFNLNRISSDGLSDIIVSIQDDDKKIAMLDEFSLDTFREIALTTIIRSIQDEEKRIKLMHDAFNLDRINNGLSEIIASIQDDDKKIAMLGEFSSDTFNGTDLTTIIISIQDEEKRIKLMHDAFNLKRIDGTGLSDIIASIEDDDKKIAMLGEFSLDTFVKANIGRIIISIQDEEKRIKLMDDAFNLKRVDNTILSYAIVSLQEDDKKIAMLGKYSLDIFDKDDLTRIIMSIRDKDKRINIATEQFDKGRIDEDYLCQIVCSIPDELKRIDVLMKQLDEGRIEEEYLYQLVFSIQDEELRFKFFTAIIKKTNNNIMDIRKYALAGFTCNPYMFDDENMIKTLEPEISKLLNLYEESPALISNLLAVINLQARIYFENARMRNPNFYLQSSIAEELSQMSKDSPDFDGYYQKMLKLISDNFNKKRIFELSRTLGPKKKLFDNRALSQEELSEKNKIMTQIRQMTGLESISFEDYAIIAILNNLNIKQVFLGGKNRSELLLQYRDALKKRIGNDDLMQLLANPDELKKRFMEATEIVFEEAMKGNGKVEDGLLTQLCTYCLNIEKRIEEEKIRHKIESKIKSNLLLTNKGIEMIMSRRVEKIIASINELEIFKDPTKKFNDKMDRVFAILYPNYNGRKDLKTLSELMKEDIRFKDKMLEGITPIEKSMLPVDKQYFKLDMNVQMAKLIASILFSISMIEDNDIPNRLKTMITNIETMHSDTKDFRPELLYFQDIDLLKSTDIATLLTFYPLIKRKELNPDNLSYYLERAKKHAMLGNKYGVVLGKTCMKYLASSAIVISNYEHYMKNMSIRTHRTIPDIKGKFPSNGRTLTYRSYDVDDPEQLIAGVRIPAEIKSSCFRINGAQDQTIRYITTSPNGIIVAVEDDKGKFLGRVYGFRVGNAVHFTRVYYCYPYDFKAAIKAIGKSIIEGSNEIEYVTCIDETCIGNRYIKENNMPSPPNITITQEGNTIYTDHYGDTPISIVASRKPLLGVEEIEFNRENNTEVFYKKKKEPIEIIDVQLAKNNAGKQDEYAGKLLRATSIVYRSNATNDFVDHLEEASIIVLGQDFIIIDKDGEKPLPIVINYGEGEAAQKCIENAELEIVDALKELMKYKETKEAVALYNTQSEETLDDSTNRIGGR